VGGDPLAATEAAGSILLPTETRRGRLLLAAVPVHLALSFGWASAIAFAAPRGREIPFGAAAGLAIAGLDLGVIGRRSPASALCAPISGGGPFGVRSRRRMGADAAASLGVLVCAGAYAGP
jgi:hypothetical protein